MTIIWLNHFVLIPFILDKKRYVLYGVLLFACIFIGAYIRSVVSGGHGLSKMFFFLIYTTGAGMAVFFLRRSMHIQKKNNEKEKLQKELELNYLKEQVNPHFLFNSLNSIYALSREQSPETPDVVMQLSELMRYQLESAKKDSVLLKEELQFIENYLLLEDKRLGKRCTIDFIIKGEAQSLKIAPMLLIPFVENAIKHGAQSTNKPSSIDVSATIDNKRLHLQVLNSKPVKVGQQNRTGTGLTNVKRRLNLLYPTTHTLEIDESVKEYCVNLTIDLTV
ncbi:sensor histidine kinase [Seonamhaeicola marinus]|nr:histidine kinase [Seonamhaeicola marinus]